MNDQAPNVLTPVQRTTYRLAAGLAVLAGLFTLLVCGLEAVVYLKGRAADPLNSTTLVELREQYSQGKTEALRPQIREADFRARAQFFTTQRQLKQGARLGVGGTVVLLVCIGITRALRKKLPYPDEAPDDEAFWGAVARSRVWVAAGGSIMIATAVVLGLAIQAQVTPAAVAALQPATAVPAVTAQAAAAAAATVTYGAVLKEWPSFRGPQGSGYAQRKSVPTAWNEKDKKNIVWKIKIPIPGLSSPVIWGDKVFLSGATREKREVYCINKADGKIAWTGTYKTSGDASTDYEVYADLESVMYAAPTPAVDGQRVYAIFANGELVAFDIKTGKALWSKVVGNTEGNTYGLSNSLLVHKGSVICHFVGDDTPLVRYDGATGKEIWKVDSETCGWPSPILAKVGEGFQVICAGDPNIAGFDAETGKKLWSHDVLSGDVAPSPTAGGGMAFIQFANCGIFGIDLANPKELKWTVEGLEEGSISDAGSMVTDGKYVYQFYNDVLSVLDAKTGKIAYEKVMDNSTSYASPMIVNDTLYLFCGDTTYVCKAGPAFEKIGEGTLEEYTDVSPAVEDGRIYIRTEENLYCIGEK